MTDQRRSDIDARTGPRGLFGACCLLSVTEANALSKEAGSQHSACDDAYAHRFQEQVAKCSTLCLTALYCLVSIGIEHARSPDGHTKWEVVEDILNETERLGRNFASYSGAPQWP